MIEITVKIPSQLSQPLQEIAEKRFDGNVTAVMQAALESYLFSKQTEREQLKQLVQEIRTEVAARGGIDETDLNRRIREYRKAAYPRK
ncbi:hypothetical protein HUU05_08300 [candidate division KSB1 bacterium]|nr:hypothetical protein [candidate division KSB1 bacterium]